MMLKQWLRPAAAPVSLLLWSVLVAFAPQEARRADRDAAPKAREVVPRTTGLRTVTPTSADDLFSRLPGALESDDDRTLTHLLAPVEVSLSLTPAASGDAARRVGPDQAFYMLREYFDAARISPDHRLGLSGYTSPTGRIVCVPGEDGTGDRQHAVVHFMADRGEGVVHQRVWVEARHFTAGSPLARGWRVAEFRILD